MPSLDSRVASTRRAVEERRSLRGLTDLEHAAGQLEPIRPFTEGFVGEEISFVVRVKSSDPVLLELAEQAELAGVAAALETLGQSAKMSKMPLLLTDLIVDPYQLFEARLAGAGGVQLVAAAFDDDELVSHLHGLAVSIGLDVIVEVADEEEIEWALELLDPDSFLIRNRDADDSGEINLERTFSLLEEVPAGKVVVSQGGIRHRDEVESLERSGVDAAILGPWAATAELAETLRVMRGG
ncbi:MAG: indole-3-glycerol phosphate synthase [Gaiellales bacterium]|jgi:indole-3-glycerol phosphate synthase|nr:indole-3-glycerol phosphate synthase [Gaiellales bacterium]